MYQITDAGGHGTVPAFLSKLWSLVEDPNYDHLIRWGENGQSFHVFEQAQFAKEVLPLYFKHSNIASFIRQLNMYGFRKVMNVDQGGLKSDKDDLEFQHPYFLKGEEHLLEHIKRKVHKSPFDMVSVKPIDSMKVNQSDISKVLTDITSLRGKQDNMSVKLDTMKRENEALWREVANLRQKHVKQQQIVNKLIGFLVTLVGGNRRPGLKRKMPLMLADSSQVAAAKSPKISEQITLDDNKNNYTVQSPNSASPLNTGPIIHDVTDFLTVHDLDEDSLPQTGSDRLTIDESIPPDNSDKFLHRSTPTPPIATGPRTQTGNSQTNSSTTPPKLDDINLEQAQSYFPFRPTLPPEHCSEMSNHLEGMQMDINNLKDILGSPTYNFDPSVLLELFDADNQLNPNLQNDVSDNGTNLFPSTSSLETPDLSVGNELVQYTPSLFDLTDDSSDFLSPNPVASHDEFVDLDLMLNTPLPHDMNEYKFPQGGVSADDLD